jgi:PAS domain S-box-containing protein
MHPTKPPTGTPATTRSLRPFEPSAAPAETTDHSSAMPDELAGAEALMARADAARVTKTFADLVAAAPVIAFVKDAVGRYVYANAYLLSGLEVQLGPEWYGRRDSDIWPPEVAARIRKNDAAALRGGGLPAFTQPMPFPDGEHTLLIMKFPLVTDDGRILLAGVGLDVTERAKTEGDRDRLAAAIEQVAESVVITDLQARITYVNPAFERVTGYSRDEVIGENPRLLDSGAQDPSFYEAMWAALVHGDPWAADFVNRRKDGSLFTEEAVISPIRDGAGAVTSYVAVNRDVTHERRLEERSVRFTRERSLIADTIRGLRAGDTPEATAMAICRQVASLTGITAAQLFVFELDGRAMPFGFVIPGQPDPTLMRLPDERSRELHDRAGQGPWIEPWVDRPWHPDNVILSGMGDHLAAYAPVRYDGELVGLLVIDALGSVDGSVLIDSLPSLVEFADLAGALIGRDVTERSEVRKARDTIRSIIDRGEFRPVFQPIVDLERDAVVGYEALTRFSDGVPPDVRFSEAHVVGLGLELEAATLRVSLAASSGLPPGAWLNLNVSPGLIVAREPLRSMVAASRRRLVLEVTEHVAIADYDPFRAALAELGPTVRLAVDDAGAGFASLRHILELRPAFVKLDRWLVAGLEGDEARKAMIVGLHHFAGATDCQLIAEGVETDAELTALHTLGIELGQGFLLGRPLPASDAVTIVAGRANVRAQASPVRRMRPSTHARAAHATDGVPVRVERRARVRAERPPADHYPVEPTPAEDPTHDG